MGQGQGKENKEGCHMRKGKREGRKEGGEEGRIANGREETRGEYRANRTAR